MILLQPAKLHKNRQYPWIVKQNLLKDLLRKMFVFIFLFIRVIWRLIINSWFLTNFLSINSLFITNILFLRFISFFLLWITIIIIMKTFEVNRNQFPLSVEVCSSPPLILATSVLLQWNFQIKNTLRPNHFVYYREVVLARSSLRSKNVLLLWPF